MTTYIAPGVQIKEGDRIVSGGAFSGNRRIGIIATGNPVNTIVNAPITRTPSSVAGTGEIFLRDVTPVLNDLSVVVGNDVRYITNTVGFKAVFTHSYQGNVGDIINNGETHYATLDETTGEYSVETIGSGESLEDLPEGALEVVAVKGSGGTVGAGEIDISTILNASFDYTVNDWINEICQTNIYLTLVSDVYTGGATWETIGALYLINDTFSGYNVEGYIKITDIQTGTLKIIANPVSDADVIPNSSAELLVGVLRVGSVPEGADYTPYINNETPYDYKIVGNTIEWAGGVKRPNANSVYYIIYRTLKDSSYYKPITYYSYDEMVNVERDIYIDGVIVNHLLLAAKIAFLNGATEIIVRQLQQREDGYVTNAEIDSALDDMGAIDFEILLTPGIYTKDADMLVRLQQWNTPTAKKERLWFTSLPNDSTPAQIKAKALSMATSKYVTVFAPKGNVVLPESNINEQGVLVFTGADVVVDVYGDLFGAAVAGLMCNPNYDKANPITNQAVAGISYPTNMPATPVWTDTVLNDMAASGVLLMYNDNGVTRVRHALTTNTTNQMTQELQIRWISILTIKELRLQLKPYIGTKAVPRVVGFIRNTMKSYLEQGIIDEVYTDYDKLVVAIDTTDIRKINASVDIQPVGTTTYINLDFGFVNQI